jgi:hypothetical protein
MRRFLGVALLALALATSTSAATLTYVATLDGPSENPSNPSLGTGTATLVIDTTANTATLSVTFGGLSSTTNGAHIHCCVAPPQNVGIAIGSVNLPLGVPQGSFTDNYDLLSSGTYNATFLTNNGGNASGAMSALLAGLAGGQAYFNIHTVASPGGEIRGFFAVPEPSVLALLAAAALGLLLAQRRAA